MDQKYYSKHTLTSSVILDSLKENNVQVRRDLYDKVQTEAKEAGFSFVNSSTFDTEVNKLIFNGLCERIDRGVYAYKEPPISADDPLREKLKDALKLSNEYVSSIKGLFTGLDYISAEDTEIIVMECIKSAYERVCLFENELSNAKTMFESLSDFEDEYGEDFDDTEEFEEMGMML